MNGFYFGWRKFYLRKNLTQTEGKDVLQKSDTDRGKGCSPTEAKMINHQTL